MEPIANMFELDFNSISSQLSLIDRESPYGNDGKRFISIAEDFAEELPKELRQALRRFSRYSNKEGYLLVRVPGFDLPRCNTPQTMKDPWSKESFSTEIFLSALGSALGDVFTYKQMHNGVMVHNLFPVEAEAKDLSSLSSETFLDLHTEASFHPFYPDYLIIACLRSDRDKKATSILSSVEAALKDLSMETIEILRQPLFQTGIQHNAEVEGPGPVIAILSGDRDEPFINFDPDLMVGTTDKASSAIKELKAALDKHRIEFLLNAGDFLILDNRKILHGRYSFKAYFDGMDRWLQRVYVTKNWKGAVTMYSSNSRAFQHDFMKIY